MKTLATTLFALFSVSVFVTVAGTEEKEICGSGICVVEFNAGFNAQNSASGS